MSIIDKSKWLGNKHFEWFKNYTVPYYDINVRMDVTNVVRYTKKHHISFFICMLYLITRELNKNDVFKMRIENDEINLYEKIDVAYTVLLNDDEHFENVISPYIDNLKMFSQQVEHDIDETKKQGINNLPYNGNRLDLFFISSFPWVDYISLSNPMNNDRTISIPRINFGKYTENNGKICLTMTIQVHHSLVEGRMLAKAIDNIQAAFDEIDQIC